MGNLYAGLLGTVARGVMPAEVKSPEYLRQGVTLDEMGSNINAITFPTALTDWAKIDEIGLFDSIIAGKKIASQKITPFFVKKADVVTIPTLGLSMPSECPTPRLPMTSMTEAVFTVIRNATQITGGQRIMVSIGGNLEYADQTNLTHADRLCGMTLNAANIGEPLKIQTVGNIRDPIFTWAIGTPLYLGTNGLLTEIVPTTGILWQLAEMVAENTILLNPQNLVIL